MNERNELPSSESPEISTGKTSPLPWGVGGPAICITEALGAPIAVMVNIDARALATKRADAEFIVLAVNSHADLVKALEAITEHLHGRLRDYEIEPDVLRTACAALAKALR